MAAMQSFITTALIGTIVVTDTHKEGNLDIKHPIKKIVVYRRNVVDGLSITYQLTGGKELTTTHGYNPSTPASAHTVTLSDTERLVGVFGINGYHGSYKRIVFLRVVFVIFDAVTASTRIVDPFSSGHGGSAVPEAEANKNAVETTEFYVSDVVAFGGFHTPGTEQGTGIDGLFFYKNIGTQ
ncbi:hypothetical protein GY45DRAFT_437237 [Cubamyces sp. BRFM 1775]|nr:hypothetical protein GY45DRAFT_437237 [Cubamyces sp. BRFM 1775]